MEKRKVEPDGITCEILPQTSCFVLGQEAWLLESKTQQSPPSTLN